jgi:hypothetical protein
VVNEKEDDANRHTSRKPQRTTAMKENVVGVIIVVAPMLSLLQLGGEVLGVNAIPRARE